MNCLDFRRCALTEPKLRNAEALRHQRECRACASFVEQLRADEAMLAEAVRLDVPEGLVERVLLRQSVEGVRRHRAHRYKLMALAATFIVALTAVLAVTMLERPVSTERLVMQHIRNELDHLADRRNVQLAQVNAVLRPFGSELSSELGTMHYAGACTIRRERGAHLVISGERGPVTILLMPEERVEGRVPIQDRRFSGVVIPVGSGSVAIVGETGEPLDAIEERVVRSLRVQS